MLTEFNGLRQTIDYTDGQIKKARFRADRDNETANPTEDLFIVFITISRPYNAKKLGLEQ